MTSLRIIVTKPTLKQKNKKEFFLPGTTTKATTQTDYYISTMVGDDANIAALILGCRQKIEDVYVLNRKQFKKAVKMGAIVIDLPEREIFDESA